MIVLKMTSESVDASCFVIIVLEETWWNFFGLVDFWYFEIKKLTKKSYFKKGKVCLFLFRKLKRVT